MNLELLPDQKREMIVMLAELRRQGKAWDEITNIVGAPAQNLARAPFAETLNTLQRSRPTEYAQVIGRYGGNEDEWLQAADRSIVEYNIAKAAREAEARTVAVPAAPEPAVLGGGLLAPAPTHAHPEHQPSPGLRFLTTQDIGWIIETARNAAREELDNTPRPVRPDKTNRKLDLLLEGLATLIGSTDLLDDLKTDSATRRMTEDLIGRMDLAVEPRVLSSGHDGSEVPRISPGATDVTDQEAVPPAS